MMLPVYFNAVPLLLPKTGIRQYAYQLLKQLQRMQEIEAHYFYLVGWSDQLLEGSAAERPSKLWHFKNMLRNYVPMSLEIQHRLRGNMFRRGLDQARGGIYHELNFLPFETKLPTVVTVHDLSVLRYPQTHPAARVKFMEKRLADAVQGAAFVLTDSEYVRQEVITEYSVPESRVVTVLLAASEGYRPQSYEMLNGVLARYNLACRGYFLSVGTLEPRKNLATAIRAFAALPDRMRKENNLVIVGMRGWENTELDRILAPLLQRGEIRILGFVPDDELPALYSGATAFIYPSLYEGFGLPPLEAMACGTPVISSNRASLPEVVGEAGITVDALDVDGLRDAMRRLIENPEERELFSRQGLLRSKLFSWQRTAEETAAVYRAAVQI
ncbi:MAG: glycosyltransferase family 1 protein [Sideroxyarcus sp.]|nr:glycosyltransferase family 1 protein [Sideroxyarcus sp.]